MYLVRKANPLAAAKLERQKLPGLGFYPRGAPDLPPGPRGVRRARLCRHGQQGAGRARAVARQGALGAGGEPDGRQGLPGACARRREHAPGDAGQERPAHDRPPDPGERRGRARRHGEPLRREGRLGDRDGPADRRDPRHGGRAGIQREPLPDDTRGPAAQPGRDGHVRAGLDVQARDRRGGARRGHGHATDDVPASAAAPRRRPRHPRGAHARNRAATASARSSSTRRTSGRSPSRRGSAKGASRPGSTASASGS